MILNFTNERLTHANPTNAQTLNLTTLNYTTHNETSFANEQSYCLQKPSNVLNNTINLDDVNNSNLVYSFQNSMMPSMQPSVNPTFRHYIINSQLEHKMKNPSVNRLVQWYDEYTKMLQNQQENNRFYFIKILNPFPQQEDNLDKNLETTNNEVEKGVFQDANEIQNGNNDQDKDQAIRDDVNQLQKNRNSSDEESKNNVDPKQIGNQLIMTQAKRENNKAKQSDIHSKVINIVDKNDKEISDEEEEEKKQDIQIQYDNNEICQSSKTQQLKLNLKLKNTQKNQSRGNDHLKPPNTVKNGSYLDSQQFKEFQQKLQNKQKFENIFKNSSFSKNIDNSPQNNENTFERNQIQQRELRDTLKEFLSYPDIIPIDLQTTQKWKVSRLKRFLFSTELSSCKFAKLLYQGKELRDMDMIYDYRIQPGHIIQAVVQKEELLNQFLSNTERKKRGIQSLLPANQPNEQLANDNQQRIDNRRNDREEQEGDINHQQIVPSHQQRSIFTFMNQQGFDKLKEQHNISDRDIILQRIQFHSKAMIARENYQNLSDLLTREEKWLQYNFRKVDSYYKFRNYDFQKEQSFPYSQQFLKSNRDSSSEQQLSNIDLENQKQKMSTLFIQFVCGALLGYMLGIFLFLLLYFKIEVCTISRTFIYSILAGIFAKSFFITFQFVFNDQISLFV